jgi:hypothetical protein
MEQLLIAIALWCGNPNSTRTGGLGDINYLTAKDVNQCRSQIIRCLGTYDPMSYSKKLDCFKNAKIGE